jgi:hypothetical protein
LRRGRGEKFVFLFSLTQIKTKNYTLMEETKKRKHPSKKIEPAHCVSTTQAYIVEITFCDLFDPDVRRGVLVMSYVPSNVWEYVKVLTQKDYPTKEVGDWLKAHFHVDEENISKYPTNDIATAIYNGLVMFDVPATISICGMRSYLVSDLDTPTSKK